MGLSISDWLDQITADIARSGMSTTPRLDAEVLIAHFTGWSRAYLLTHGEDPVGNSHNTEIWEVIQKRCAGWPVAYLTGVKEFWSLPFKVNQDVLIPRPDTEVLVERALTKIRSQGSRILDLGTGSGAIAVAIGHERPNCQVVATDRSDAALQVAQQNAEMNSVDNIEFVHSDWFESLPKQSFDLIVSNPPYIDPQDDHLQGEVRFEPRGALVSHQAGLEDIAYIIANTASFMNEKAWLLLEHGLEQGKEVRQMMAQANFSDVQTLRDYSGNERVTEGQYG